MIRTTTIAFTVAIATGATAQMLDINGGSSWAGWDFRGNSLTGGIWASGDAGNDFDMYTRAFFFDSSIHAPTGSFFGSNGFSGNGFADGNLILAIGLSLNSSSGSASDTFLAVPTVKMDVDNNNGFAPASAVGASDGLRSSSLQTIGDFNQQYNGTRSNDGTPSFFGLHQGGSVLDFTAVFAVDAGPTRSFYDAAGGGYQLFLDLTEYESGLGTGAFGSTVSFAFGSGLLGAGSQNTDIVLSNIVVPAPASAMLLAIAGAASIRRRR